MLEDGAIRWFSRVAGGEVGWKTCFDARVDFIVEDVATLTFARKLGGTVREGVD